MRNEKGYRDPTASIAVGNVTREEKQRAKMLKLRDGTPVAERQKFGGGAARTWKDVLNEFKEIDKERER